jgi:hypothetical protein
MAQHWRHFWGPQKTGKFNFQWDAIRHDSFVVITASEGEPRQEGVFVDPSSPRRFVGSAHFQVSSVAPHDGGVTFWVIIGDPKATFSPAFFNWWVDPLNLWTDITVFEPGEPSGQN